MVKWLLLLLLTAQVWAANVDRTNTVIAWDGDSQVASAPTFVYYLTNSAYLGWNPWAIYTNIASAGHTRSDIDNGYTNQFRNLTNNAPGRALVYGMEGGANDDMYSTTTRWSTNVLAYSNMIVRAKRDGARVIHFNLPPRNGTNTGGTFVGWSNANYRLNWTNYNEWAASTNNPADWKMDWASLSPASTFGDTNYWKEETPNELHQQLFVQRVIATNVYLRLTTNTLAARTNYTPPTGIPHPSVAWGINPFTNQAPEWPAQWPVWECAGWYFVDNTHPSATDTSNTYGYPWLPRLTMPPTLAAGAVVHLRGGNYSNSVTLTANGTAGSPVFIVGDTNSRTELRGDWTIADAQFLFVENLKWTQDKIVTISPTAGGVQIANVMLRNCEVAGTGVAGANGAAFVVGEATHLVPTNIVFFECVARDYGDWTAVAENDRHGFSVGTGTQYVWWLRCQAYHNGGDGFGNGHDANHSSHHLYLGDSSMWENRENAVDLKEVHDVVVSSNAFWGYRTTGSSEGAAIIVHYGPDTTEGATNIFILNNRIWASDIGIASTESHQEAYWAGNLVYDCLTGLYPDRGGGTFNLFNNTVLNCGYGIYCSGTVDGLVLRNNLVLNATNETVRVTSSTVRSASTWANDLYYSGVGNVNINWGGTTYTSVAAWNTATSKGATVLAVDPVMSSTYFLSTGSPAIDAGTSVSNTLESAYSAVFGTSLAYRDMAGLTLGGSPDLGALQYEAGHGGDGGSGSPVGIRLSGRMILSGGIRLQQQYQ